MAMLAGRLAFLFAGLPLAWACSSTETCTAYLNQNPEDADAWCDLGVTGGGEVTGTQYTRKQCYEQALKFDPKYARAWYNLGVDGGGEVAGAKYTEQQCFSKAQGLYEQEAREAVQSLPTVVNAQDFSAVAQELLEGTSHVQFRANMRRLFHYCNSKSDKCTVLAKTELDHWKSVLADRLPRTPAAVTEAVIRRVLSTLLYERNQKGFSDELVKEMVCQARSEWLLAPASQAPFAASG